MPNTPDYSEILSRKFPGREWSMSGNNPDTLKFTDDGPKITKAELDLLWPDVQLEISKDKAEKNYRDELFSEHDLESIVLMLLKYAISENKTALLDLWDRTTVLRDKYGIQN